MPYPRQGSGSPLLAVIATSAAIVVIVAGCGDNLSARDDDAGGAPGCGGLIGGGGDGVGGTGGFGIGGESGRGGGGAAGNFFTVIALPDTQYYSSTYPDVFAAQMRWIIEQKASLRIAFVLHEGDIVDSDVSGQWETAAANLHKLDGIVPYVLAQGNHDYLVMGGVGDRSTLINQYFSLAALAAEPGFLGSFEPDRIENTARILKMGDMPWLVVSLEFGPRDAVLTWADGVLKAHAGTKAMVVTHAYQYWDGTRYDHVTRPEQLYNPHAYAAAPPPGSVNDGEEMWTKLISANENVEFVFNGHIFHPTTGEAAATLTSTHPSGRSVHQIVANYQQAAYGGGGYLRLMEFCPDTNELRVSTYSPFLNLWKRDAANQFTLPLP